MSVLPDGENRYASFPLFLAGVFFVVLAPVFWLNTDLPQGAHGTQTAESTILYDRIYPCFHFGFSQLREGHLPLWNPMQLCGAPFLADPGTGVFQPLNAVFLLLTTEQGMAVHGFLALFLMGLFFVLFARALDIGYTPALVGAVVYAFSGAAATALPQPEVLSTLAWTPLLFWAVREFAREGRYSVAVLGGAACALMVLCGAGAALAAMLATAVPYAALRTILGGGIGGTSTFGRRIFGFMLLGATALLLSAVQWLPTAVWLIHTESPWPALFRLELAGQFPAKLSEIPVQLLSAASDVFPHAIYVGAATLLLFPVAFLHRVGRTEVIFFTVTCAAFLPLAVIGHTLWGAPFPCEALVFPAVFALATLAALGADRLFMVGRDPRLPLVWAPSLLVLAAALALLYVASAELRGRLLALAGVILMFSIFRLRSVGAVCAFLIALLLFVDLYAASVRYYPHPFFDTQTVYAEHAKLLKAAEEQAVGSRVLVNTHPLEKRLTANLGMVAPLRAAGGSRWPLTPDQARWWKALHPEGKTEVSPRAAHPALLNYMAVRALLVAGGVFVPEGWEQQGVRLHPSRTEQGLSMYINDSVLPRCYWAPGWRAVPDLDTAITVLSDPAFDGRQACVVEQGTPAYAQLATMVPSGATPPDPKSVFCIIEEEAPERVIVRVEAPQPGVTVLADTYAEGWRATLDGLPMPILKVNGLFRGIATPSGPHSIEFTYQPWPFWAGLSASLGTLGLLALGGLIGLVRRH